MADLSDKTGQHIRPLLQLNTNTRTPSTIDRSAMTNNLMASNNSSTSASTSSSSRTPATSNGPAVANTNAHKKSPNDFRFECVVGEGSFSTVYKSIEVSTNRTFAIKTCEKTYIRQEKMHEAIMKEKEIMTILTNHQSPFLIRLYCSFQDEHRLYFVMNYAENGELLKLLNKVGSFDEECTRFYAAEMLQALEHMHRLNIIHRDLKPENILLNSNMHIMISDFGTACQPKPKDQQTSKKSANANATEPEVAPRRIRRNSFVGTVQYVSPEMLSDRKNVDRPCDLWALGCIIYQLTSGSLAFKAHTEFATFNKILKLEYEFPDGFNETIKDLIKKFLRIKPEERLGARDELSDKVTNEPLPYKSIRAHPFFAPLKDRWENLHNEEPPQVGPYLPGTSHCEELRSDFKCNVKADIEPGLDDKQITRLLGLQLYDDTATSSHYVRKSIIVELPEEEKRLRLERQEKESKWHRFVDGNLILKEGFINKRKGLFARRRMFLLTTGPHLYYVDEEKMVRKGEIPWSTQIKPELKNFKNFFVHTPKRIYYLEDPSGFAPKWCEAIEDVKRHYYRDLERREKSEGKEN